MGYFLRFRAVPARMRATPAAERAAMNTNTGSQAVFSADCSGFPTCLSCGEAKVKGGVGEDGWVGRGVRVSLVVEVALAGVGAMGVSTVGVAVACAGWITKLSPGWMTEFRLRPFWLNRRDNSIW